MKIRLFFVCALFFLFDEKKDFSPPCQISLPVSVKCACFRCINTKAGKKRAFAPVLGSYKEATGRAQQQPCDSKLGWHFWNRREKGGR